MEKRRKVKGNKWREASRKKRREGKERKGEERKRRKNRPINKETRRKGQWMNTSFFTLIL